MSTGHTSCDREPIHIPGAIQAHGLMLVADRDGLKVRQVAGEIERRLGIADFEARALPELLGETLTLTLTLRIEALVQSGGNGSFIGQSTTSSGELWTSAPTSAVPMCWSSSSQRKSATLPASLVLDRLEAASSASSGPRR